MWSTRSLFSTEAVLTSKLSQRRSVTPTGQRYEHSYANAWDGEFAIFAPTCADAEMKARYGSRVDEQSATPPEKAQIIRNG